MRIKIELNPDKLMLPYSYRRGIQAFIYSCLNQDSAQYYHDFSDDSGMKPFVYSNLLGKFTKNDNKLIFEDKCVLYIASVDLMFLKQIYDYLLQNRMMVLYQQYIPISEIKIIENCSNDGVYTYRCISPITVYQKINDRYKFYSPNDDEFKALIMDNLNNKFFKFYQTDKNEYCNLYQFTNIRKQVCEYKGFYYDAYRLEFKLSATALLHDLVMDTGLGYRNAIGFGMVEKKQ